MLRDGNAAIYGDTAISRSPARQTIIEAMAELEASQRYEKLRRRNKQLRAEVHRLELDARPLKHASDLSTAPAQGMGATSAQLAAEVKLHRDRADELSAIVTRQASEAAAYSARLDRMLASSTALTKKYDKEVKKNVELSERITETALANQKMEIKVKLLNEQLKQCKKQFYESNALLRARTAAGRSPSAAHTEHPDTERRRELEDRVEPLQAEIAKLAATNARLRAENRDIKRELGSLDHAFFEELEDLKFGLAEANRLNAAYDKTLRVVCAKAGLEYEHIRAEVMVTGPPGRRQLGTSH